MSSIVPEKAAVTLASSEEPNSSTAAMPMARPASLKRAVLMAFRPCCLATCPISWARMAATASSLSAQRSRPRLTKMRPPGAAKALISSESRIRKWYPPKVSGRSETRARLWPSRLR